MSVKNKSVTIADVAERIGVSKSTVSHALSGKRRISAEVKRQVELAVVELGYRPNFAARVMNTRQTGLVGVLVPNLQNYHTTSFLEALGRELARHSLQLVLSTTDHLTDGENVLRKFSSGMVDAIVNTLPELSDAKAAELARGVPMITYLRHAEAALTIDFTAGACQAMKHLVNYGHRRIAVIASGDRAGRGAEDPCVIGYRQVVRELGEEPLIWSMLRGNIEDGRALAETVFHSGVTAVLAGNDMVAAGILQRAIAEGVRVPQRLSIVGHDDTPMALLTSPPLTTLHLPIDVLAAHTAQVLLHAVDPEQPLPAPRRVIPQLVIRDSTAPAGR